MEWLDNIIKDYKLSKDLKFNTGEIKKRCETVEQKETVRKYFEEWRKRGQFLDTLGVPEPKIELILWHYKIFDRITPKDQIRRRIRGE